MFQKAISAYLLTQASNTVKAISPTRRDLPVFVSQHKTVILIKYPEKITHIEILAYLAK